jgi:Tfp pilus assembly protein PilF
MAETSRTHILVVAAAVLAVAVLSLVWLGLTEVPAGQVMALPDGDGGVAGVWEPGWHWRAPWADASLPLPREALAADRDVDVTTSEGARITLEVAGRFAVSAGGEGAWVEAAGWQPFLDGLGTVLVKTLTPEVRRTDPAAVFEEPRLAALATVARRALEDAGVEVDEITLAAPIDKNPVAVAAAHGRVAKLARPTGIKVLVVGWDGADWLMARPLMEQGRLPNLAKLVRGGVSGELRSQSPLLSPLIWTTIATGKTVAEHGIADFLVNDPDTGTPVPISSRSRKVHALWTLLPAFNMSTDVVAWWATWPAEQVQGTMVTDRVAYQLFQYKEQGAAAGKVYPPTAWPGIEESLVSAEDVGWEEMSRFVDVSRQELDERWSSLPPERRQEDPVNHLRKILATTRSYQDIALSLLDQQADLTMVYLEGTDTVGHLFARYLPPRLPEVSEEDVRKFGHALPSFYEWADELLGELLAKVDDDTLILLMSDHGFFTGEARPASDPSDFTAGAPQWHRLYGILAGDGPGVQHGELEGATIFDITPTILAALGLPVPEDMDGKVLEQFLPPAARDAASPGAPQGQRLATYEVLPRSRPAQVRASEESNRERLAELAALGYISQATVDTHTRGDGAEPGSANGVEAAGSAAASAQNSDGADLQGLATEAYNLGTIAHRAGRLDEAERHYRTAIERLPSFGIGWASLAQVASLRGDHGEAFDRLVQGFTKSNSMPQAAITGLVDEAKAAGRLDDAERVLGGLRRSLADNGAFNAAWGLLKESRGDLPGALESYEKALAVNPLDQLSVEQKVDILRRLGREQEARDFLSASFHRATSVSAMNQLAVVALRQRWPADAERLLRKVLESDPGNPGVLANLAAALGQQGKMAEATEFMRRAIARQPEDARNHFNLGAMLASQGRPQEALTAFEEALDLGLRSPRVYVAAAKMRFQLGNVSGAEEYLLRALEIEPGDREAQELLEILRQGG